MEGQEDSESIVNWSPSRSPSSSIVPWTPQSSERVPWSPSPRPSPVVDSPTAMPSTPVCTPVSRKQFPRAPVQKSVMDSAQRQAMPMNKKKINFSPALPERSGGKYKLCKLYKLYM